MDASPVKYVREFNRFYTSMIGLLDRHLPDSRFSLPECRILYELAQRPGCTASEIMEAINMDRGYMSRILASFQKKGMIRRKRSATDGRAYFLSLSPKGKAAFTKIDNASHTQIKNLLAGIPVPARDKLVGHMLAIQKIFTEHKH